MGEEMVYLGRRAVACRWWLIERPMSTPGFGAIPKRSSEGVLWDIAHDAYGDREWVPVLTDPATLGCLLALVREAWANPMVHARAIPGDTWEAYCREDRWDCQIRGTEAPTEAAALVAALECAP